jgi:hypothetical protein
MITSREKHLLTIISCLILIVVVVVVSGCSPVSVEIEPDASGGTTIEKQLPGTTTDRPRLHDSLYRYDTRSWLIPVKGASGLQVSPGRGIWFYVEEWDVQGIHYLPDSIVVVDTCRWLKEMYYNAIVKASP